MLIWNEEDTKKSRIEIIPMIDVMMFLLVFFVLISLNVIPALGFKTQLPGSKQPDKLEVKKHLIITISSEGRVQLDGVEHTLPELQKSLIALHEKTPNLDIVINSDKSVAVQKLVDVMDAAKGSGISSLAIASSNK